MDNNILMLDKIKNPERPGSYILAFALFILASLGK
jgi:hypothetical protein